MNEKKKINLPKKGAGRRLAEKLKEIGQRPPPPELVEKINQKDDKKKIAQSTEPSTDMDV